MSRKSKNKLLYLKPMFEVINIKNIDIVASSCIERHGCPGVRPKYDELDPYSEKDLYDYIY